MKRLALLVAFFSILPPIGHAAESKKPKLLLAITVDQFRYDYLLRWNQEYSGGLRLLLDRGAVFTDAHQDHYPTVTAVGHSAFLTGAPPSMSGIVNNEWFERLSGRTVTSVNDPATRLLGGPPEQVGSSPMRMVVSSISDEIKLSGRYPESKTIGISMKDRSAILPVGHMADGAYWVDRATGHFVSSTFFFDQLPRWVAAYNQAEPAKQYLGAEWLPVDAKPGAKAYKVLSKTADPDFYDSLPASPYGNELVESFAERAIEEEKLGQHNGIDTLSVSFSANDYIGHEVGPDAPQIRDISLRTDRLLGRLFDLIEKKVGLANTIIVLTADHGVAPLPETMNERKMPGGRMSGATTRAAIEFALRQKYGEGSWVLSQRGEAVYLNYPLMDEKKLNYADVEDAAASAARALPGMFRVFTRHQLEAGLAPRDIVDQRVARSFYSDRSSDLVLIQRPYHIFSAQGATHSSPFDYDTHVPLIFMGPGIKQGTLHTRAAVEDVAVTLATMFGVETPSGSVGRILTEIWPQ